MKIRRLNDDFTISTQIEMEKIGKVAARGYRSIICNRPDDESAGHPRYAQVETAARRAGLETAYIPIALTGATPSDGAAFARAAADLSRPILAYWPAAGSVDTKIRS